ncbi:mycothiol conjugate amidase Mca [Glycomyces buryatensis]|uniref:Mycothiol S-conjugate amidase n=1 Tax=Glycomyces buryatensis TaxID=2570927 RepID=A0A4S8QKL5_9ACTN|nr:mycothiol conjugate amidase Mca [Glycomyces buryatensis]THV41979.1 mycothiol conjugate amidase Mca [Glycomyces buryatensis]
MCVHAHPDDESSKGAATMARYVREGIEVLVVTCTGGERGDVLNPKMDRPEVQENLPLIRTQEMDRAREILGVKQHWLGFTDSGLPDGWLPDSGIALPEDAFYLVPTEAAAAPLVEIMRSFRPHVVTTYDEEGGYPHPDHVKTHEISVAAFDAAGDPERYTDRGEAWQPLKLYYQHSFGKARIEALHLAMLAAGLESPYEEWLVGDRDWARDKSERVTTRVECAECFGIRDEALKAHATQVDPDGFWFAVPRELQEKAWPTEDYELVSSHLPERLPEDDLFAGLR